MVLDGETAAASAAGFFLAVTPQVIASWFWKQGVSRVIISRSKWNIRGGSEIASLSAALWFSIELHFVK